MIVCPICEKELKNKKDSYFCFSCNFIAKKEDDIVRFHPDIINEHEDYSSLGLDSLYTSENKHFWFQHRKQNILDIFRQYVNKSEKIIEIGAGTGNVCQMLHKNGYTNIFVGEMHMNGLRYAKKYGLTELFQFDLLNTPFREHFNVVCMFDVLEHIEDENLALQNVRKMLSAEGKLIITVPAHMWLWSNIDDNSGHKRRYNFSELNTLLEKNNFKVINYRSLFILILPLLFFRSIINKKNKKLDAQNLGHNAGMNINKVMNSFLQLICKIEGFLFSKISLKFGGSLLIVAKKYN